MNSITDYDYVNVVSNFSILANRDYDCSVCKNKHKGCSDRQESLFKQRYCSGLSKNPVMKYMGKHSMSGTAKILYNKCLGNFYNYGYREIIKVHSSFENGIMPFDGGILDQPAKFIALMNLIGNLKSENIEEKEKIIKRRGINGR